MQLYLREELLSKANGYRGGKYYTRVQDGWKSNGDPKYKYFYSAEEYEKYKNDQTSAPGSSDTELARKVSHEHEESKKFAQQQQARQKIPKSKDVDPGEREDELTGKQRMLYVKG